MKTILVGYYSHSVLFSEKFLVRVVLFLYDIQQRDLGPARTVQVIARDIVIVGGVDCDAGGVYCPLTFNTA